MANQDDEQIRLLRVIAAPEIRRRKARKMLGGFVLTIVVLGFVATVITLLEHYFKR